MAAKKTTTRRITGSRRKALKRKSRTIDEKYKHLTDTYNKHYPNNLHKELWGIRNADPINSLYRWWWQFVNAAQSYPPINDEVINETSVAKQPDIKAAIEHVRQMFVGHETFQKWWDAHGEDAFKEQIVPRINIPFPSENGHETFDFRNGLDIHIPLTINKKILREQFEVLLDIYHPGNKLIRHEHSTAKIKIFPTKRNNYKDYEKMLDFWTHVSRARQNQNTDALWRLYCEFNNEQARIEYLEDPDNIDQRNIYTKVASDLFHHANELMKKAIIGEFPNDTVFQKRIGNTKKIADRMKKAKKSITKNRKPQPIRYRVG